MYRTPKECGLYFGPHRCCLYDCPPDDPFHIHVCFADDFDCTAGEVEQVKLGIISNEEFHRLGTDRARNRQRRVLNDESAHCADELSRRSYQTAMINRFENGLVLEKEKESP